MFSDGLYRRMMVQYYSAFGYYASTRLKNILSQM
jgi:ABC-type multidrug transport system permease subunit